MRIRIARVLLIAVIICAFQAAPALGETGQSNSIENSIEWNEENSCWVENVYITTEQEFFAFIDSTRSDEYELNGVSAPLLTRAYIGSAGSETLGVSLSGNYTFPIQTELYLVNASVTAAEGANIYAFGSIHIENGSSFIINGTLDNQTKYYALNDFKLNCGIYVHLGGKLDAQNGEYAGDGALYRSPGAEILGIDTANAGLAFTSEGELITILVEQSEYETLYAVGNIIISSDLTLPYGTEIIIPKGSSLTLDAGAKLSLAGNIWLDGGTLTVNDGAELIISSDSARVWINAESAAQLNCAGIDDKTARYIRYSIETQTDMEALLSKTAESSIIRLIDINANVTIDKAHTIVENDIINVNRGKLTVSANLSLLGALRVYDNAELTLNAVLTNKASGFMAGIERGLFVAPSAKVSIGAGGAYAGEGQANILGTMDGYCHAGTLADLTAALESGADTVYVNREAVITITDILLIPEGVALKLGDKARLIVSSSALLINAGTLEMSESAQLKFEKGAEFIRLGEEKLNGTVEGLENIAALTNESTGKAVCVYSDKSQEYSEYCVDRVRAADGVQTALTYRLSVPNAVKEVSLKLKEESDFVSQCAVMDGYVEITLYCGNAEADETIEIVVTYSDDTEASYAFTLRLGENSGDYMLGDMNKDCRITVSDAVLYCRAVSSREAQDIDGDGEANVKDIWAICKKIMRGL